MAQDQISYSSAMDVEALDAMVSTADSPPPPKRTKRPPDESGVWACGIPGCGKKFAREADLKRHQRTTKFHSTAGL